MYSENKKRFLIFGAGAIGSFYGGMLVKAGHNVTFISRGENYKSLMPTFVKSLSLFNPGI